MRKLAYLVHLYLGLSLGLITVLLGLTGSTLVFRHEIDTALAPNLHRVKPRVERAELALLADAVRNAYPSDEIKTINIGRSHDQAVEFWMKRGAVRVYVDPYSGRILGDRDSDKSLMGWLFLVHTELFLGERGEFVAGMSGLALVLLSLSGLVVWWPRKCQRLSDAVTVKLRSSSKRITYDLHRAVGFWSCAFLLLIGLTGAALVFPDQAKSVSYRLFTGDSAPAKPKASFGLPMRPLGELIQAAEGAMPEGELARVMLPARSGDAIIFRKRTQNELHPNGMNYIYVDPSTAEVIRVDRDSGNNAALSVMNVRYPLHIGVYAGNISRVIHAVIGLVPSVLAVTGILVWLNRRRKKARAFDRTRQGHAAL